MIFLSRLTLNPAHRLARRDLGSAYDMHRTLARVFAADAAATPPRFLWRLEATTPHAGTATVLIQGPTPGRWAVIDEMADYAQAIEADKPIDFSARLRADMHCRFRVLANATVTRDGKRHGLREAEELSAWMQRQGTRGGFDVLSVACQRRPALRLRTAERGIALDACLFDGVLRVSDPVRLARTIELGLGHGKAFGLGLLSLAPAALA